VSDTYQAVYDATRSRVSSCDTGAAVESALRDAFGSAGDYLSRIYMDFVGVASDACRPSVLYRPRIAIDGNMWGAVYGDNIQEGVAGFGESPALAMADFDKNWNARLGATP